MLSDAAVRAGLATLTRLTVAAFVCLLIVVSDAEGQAVLSGTVRDDSGGPIPGAEVTVSNDRIERRTIADSAGRYEFRDFPLGAYVVTARLPGFQTASERWVLVAASTPSGPSFTLKVACIVTVVHIDEGFAKVLQRTTTVLHVRFGSAGGEEPCPVRGFCSCVEHEAQVLRILTHAGSDVPLAPMRILQEGTGTRYRSGEEYVAFLTWHAGARVFRIGYLFPVRDGRVAFDRMDAPGLKDGLTVEEFGAALDAYRSRER